MRFRSVAIGWTLAVVLAGLSWSGCGYSLAGRGSFLPAYIKTIGVPTFVNRTAVFNMETQLTQKVRSEFLGRGKYTIVPDATGADALLTGEVLSVTPVPTTFGNDQLANRYSVRMVARVELRDQRDQKILWQNPALAFNQDFDVQTGNAALDPTTFFGQDQNALDRMTTDFAKTIVSAILEAF